VFGVGQKQIMEMLNLSDEGTLQTDLKFTITKGATFPLSGATLKVIDYGSDWVELKRIN
jgi:hypothetical protein